MNKQQVKKWNELWVNGILKMSDKECAEALCFLHGRVLGDLQYGTVTPNSIVQDLAAAIEYVKEKSLAKQQ